MARLSAEEGERGRRWSIPLRAIEVGTDNQSDLDEDEFL
jgi:hypothetical protein